MCSLQVKSPDVAKLCAVLLVVIAVDPKTTCDGGRDFHHYRAIEASPGFSRCTKDANDHNERTIWQDAAAHGTSRQWENNTASLAELEFTASYIEFFGWIVP